MTTDRPQNPSAGIVLVLIAVAAISVNDLLIKLLSGGYPLHQMVFVRSALGLVFSSVFVWMEGGLRVLRTDRPAMHALRGLLIVGANLTFFSALAVLPLAEATALFFAAPLFITLLSIPLLREKVGPWRMGAVLVGFAGIVIMQRPWQSAAIGDARWVLVLPVIAALLYALNQIMTRALGATAKASAMAVYIQAAFIVVSVAFWVVAGDGRYADVSDNASVQFLLRPWIWPEGNDRWLFLGLGMNSALVAYALTQAYRLGDAATVAPFEYIGLPLAVFWGWAIFGDLPDAVVWIGIALILSSGLFVAFRERMRARPRAATRQHRRY